MRSLRFLPASAFRLLALLLALLGGASTQAATYTSYVHVVDSLGHPLDSARIAMNEPLKRGGFTFYQASFANDPGKVSTTVLSVNRDPGRFLKYFGALLAVLSIVWYVLERSRLGRRGKSE